MKKKVGRPAKNRRKHPEEKEGPATTKMGLIQR
jgi:hypothetical protein